MKLSARDAAAWIARPDPARAATLLHGADAMRVAIKRQDLIRALIGPDGDAEMRLTRMPASELKGDPAALSDAMRASGFFPGQRCVLVEDATNAQGAAILTALKDWQPGDAHVVVTAGALPPASPLRKGIEAAKSAVAIGVYDDPMDRAAIGAAVGHAGLHDVPGDAMAELTALAQRIDPGDLRQLLEKIALYKLGDPAPLGTGDIAACAPASTMAALDDVVGIVADARADRIAPVLQRLAAQGVTPVSLCIALLRHFRALHAAASDAGGAGSGIGRLRPPVYGPRRDAMLRQAQDWGALRLERAVRVLIDTDLTLRSASRAPQMAVMERTMIRLAMMARQGG